MGSSCSKNYGNPYEKDLRSLTKKIRLLQGEIKMMMMESEKETRAYEREMIVFAFKEAEWKQEKKRLREEVKSLRKAVEEKDGIIKGMEEEMSVGANSDLKEWEFPGSNMLIESDLKEWEFPGSNMLIEQMKEERAQRDETVEKWKQLYLAIKNELDDLIQRTHQGERLYWRADEEEMMEELQIELKNKEETIQALKEQLACMENEGYKREREIDILRQSLRIMSHNKPTTVAKGLSRNLHL